MLLAKGTWTRLLPILMSNCFSGPILLKHISLYLKTQDFNTEDTLENIVMTVYRSVKPYSSSHKVRILNLKLSQRRIGT